MTRRDLHLQLSASRAREFELSKEVERLREKLTEVNEQHLLQEQLLNYACGALNDSNSKLESLKDDHAAIKKRLDIRERNLKTLQTAATRDEEIAAALEAQAQTTLEYTRSLHNDVSEREKKITAQEEENEYLKWRVEHDLMHEECAKDLQKLVDTLLEENQKLERQLGRK